MPYKDIDKQREANRRAVQAHRLRHKKDGITPSNEGITPSEVRVLQHPVSESNYRLIFAHGRWIQILI